jgi:GT2 family glycosyltransferase
VAVSALVVNYQVYSDLQRCLSALEAFLADDDEVLVVDNASDPKQLSVVAAAHPRVRFLPQHDNIGFSAGVNLAAGHAKHQYLLLLNPDALMRDPVPRVLEQWLKEHPDTGVVGPRVLNSDGSVQASARRFPDLSTALGGRSTWLTGRFPNNWMTRRNLLGRSATGPMDVDWVAGSCLMTTRSAFMRAGGLDEGFFLYFEDVDYCKRLAGLNLKCTYLPHVTVRHAGGHSAELVPELAIRAFHRSAVRITLKHGGVLAAALSPITWLAMRIRGEWCVWRATRTRRRGAVSESAKSESS